jgi:hypothetical protein
MQAGKFDFVLPRDSLSGVSFLAGKVAGQAATGRQFTGYGNDPRSYSRASARPLEQKSHARRFERRQTSQIFLFPFLSRFLLPL